MVQHRITTGGMSTLVELVTFTTKRTLDVIGPFGKNTNKTKRNLLSTSRYYLCYNKQTAELDFLRC